MGCLGDGELFIMVLVFFCHLPAPTSPTLNGESILNELAVLGGGQDGGELQEEETAETLLPATWARVLKETGETMQAEVQSRGHRWCRQARG